MNPRKIRFIMSVIVDAKYTPMTTGDVKKLERTIREAVKQKLRDVQDMRSTPDGAFTVKALASSVKVDGTWTQEDMRRLRKPK